MINQKYKILVVGENASILGFRGQGLDVHIFEEEEYIEKELFSLIDKQEYAVIFMTPFVVDRAKNVIETYRALPLPALIQIPMGRQEGEDGLKSLQESVKRAIGFDVLGQEDFEEELPEEDYDYYA